MNNMAAR